MMQMITLLALAAATAAGKVQTSLRRHISSTHSFVRTLDFQHKLRVCNAYPFAAALDVIRNKDEKLTNDAPMPYKSCKDFSVPLMVGDKLEFKIGDATTGTFAISDLPNFDAVLLLAVHRHDTLSTAVSFESHVFSNLENAQVAVIDTYKGAGRSTPRIMDVADSKGSNKKEVRSEELRFDSVVAVKPGRYEVDLDGQDGATKSKASLVALGKQSYVVMRTGVESQQGASFPQELVVYPQSDARMLPSSAVARTAWGALLAAAFGTAFAW